eukprot:scaffold46991_cov23-Tisochrysis_lutea.AAC.1
MPGPGRARGVRVAYALTWACCAAASFSCVRECGRGKPNEHHPLLRNTMNTSKRTKKKTELSGFTSQGMGLADLGSEGLAAAQEVFWGACWLLFFLSLFPKTKPASSCTRPVRVQKRVRTQLTFSSSWATSSLRSDNSRSTLP